jgi:putative endonuclease
MKSLGDNFEDRAAALLEEQGLRLLERNFRAKAGEIDIIAQDGTQLVFVEVRARNNRYYDSAAGSVDSRKQQRIVRTAQLFLQRRPQCANMPCRFDVVAFEPPQSGTRRRIRWIRGAFTA